MITRNIVHIEIPSDDDAKAAKFYHDLFGWKIEREEAMGYTMWEPTKGPGGGFSPISETVKPGNVLIYVDSADIESDLKEVEKLGGVIVTHKTEIPQIGWFGVFKDPTGNMIALYTSMNPEYNQ